MPLEGFRAGRIIALALGFVFSLCACALTWAGLHKLDGVDESDRRPLEFSVFFFMLFWIVSLLRFLVPLRATVLGVLQGALMFKIFLDKNDPTLHATLHFPTGTGWTPLNFLRVSYQNHDYIQGDKRAHQEMLGSLVVGYFGLFITLLGTLHRPEAPEHGTAYKIFRALSIITAIVTAAIGSIILYTSEFCEIDNDEYAKTFQITATALSAILLLVLGSLSHNSLFIAALFASAYLGIPLLQTVFQVHTDIQDNDKYSSEDKDKFWAGGVFCWFSAIATTIAAIISVYQTSDASSEYGTMA